MTANNFVSIYFIATFVVCSVYEVKSILPPSTLMAASDAPFMVYIHDDLHYCGGAILSENIVLTAGHCVTNSELVEAGRNYKYTVDNAQIVTVKKTLTHEEYAVDPNGVQAYNDIALLLLDTPLTFNQYVKPIEWTNDIDFRKKVTVFGWGSTDAFINDPSSYLRAKNISLIPDDACIELLKNATTKCTKQVYELCGEKSACNGDSGSPVVQKVNNGTKLIGIVSWLADDNIDCDTAPAVFDNVGYFSTWIKDGMKALSKTNDADDQNANANVVKHVY